MKRSGFSVAWVLLVCGFTVAATAAPRVAAPPRVLVVVGDSNRLAYAEAAVADLARLLPRLTGGGSVDVVRLEKPAPLTRSEAHFGQAVYVGAAADLAACGLDVPADLKPQEALAKTLPVTRLALAGGDAWGVSAAIYRFLEEKGCRWYYPGEAWEVVPPPVTNGTFALDARWAPPAFDIQRRIWIGHGMHSGKIQKDYTDWMRRNRAGAPVSVACSHSWPVPQEAFTNHPEWFALVRGQRSNGKPCYSHPEVVKRGIERALAYFKANPAADMISVSAPDGIGYCTCELCLKTAGVASCVESNGTFFGRRADGVEVCVVSETIFRYANAVAKAVAAAHPGKLVGCLAYSSYAHPPSFGLEPNLYVEITRGYRRTPLSQAEQLAAFAKIASMLGIYEYYDVMQWSWDQPGAARASDLTYLGETIRYYHRNKIRSLSGEMSNNFGPNGIGYYLILRLLEDPARGVREVEEDFYRRAFGPAGDPVRRFYRRWESGQRLDNRTLGLAYLDLQEAADKAKGLPEVQRRVDDLRMYGRFLKLYEQPKQGANEAADVERLKKQYGEEGAKARVQALGDWAARIMDTHMVHGWAFNRYLIRRGDALGCATKEWMKPGAIPTGEEMDRLFAADLAELKPDRSKEVPDTLWSRKLVSRDGKLGTSAGDFNLQADRGLTLIVRTQADLATLLGFAAPMSNALPAALFVPREEFEQEWLEPAGTPCQPAGFPSEKQVSFKGPGDGYLMIGMAAAPVSVAGKHVLLKGGALKTGKLHFWVPKGTPRFLLTVKGQGKGVTVRDGAGKTVYQSPEGKTGGQHLVEVPEGTSGAAWSVEGPGDVNGTAVLGLVGVPPWFALSPEQLLVPVEAM